MSVRTRVILAIILTNLLILVLSIAAGGYHARRNIEQYIEADMLAVADIADRFISAELELLRDDARDIAADLAAEPRAGRAKTLGALSRLYPKFTGMAILRRDGAVEAAAGDGAAPPGLRDNPAIRSAFDGKTAFTSTIPSGDGVAIHLASPFPRDGEYALVLSLPGEYFTDLTAMYTVWKTGHIFIDDSEGSVIANSRRDWVRERRNFLRLAREDRRYGEVASLIEKAASGERGIGFYSLDGASRICAYRPISQSPEGWFLGIVAPLSESPIRNFDRGLLLIAAVSMLLNVTIAVLASNSIRKPFEELAALKEEAEANARAKSGLLAQMSHEIRTPLNAVVGLSELALKEEAPGSGRADRLETIRASGLAILALADDILNASRIDAGRFDRAAAIPPPAGAAAPRSAAADRVALPRARVLVVDDNATNLDIAKGIMKPYGMRIDCVTGGRQAVEAIRAGTPVYDAVFMDHMMPEMDGLEATRRIREIGTDYAATIPVIALTANAIAGTEAMFLRNGFQAFLPKPIDLARLEEILRKFVRNGTRESAPDGVPGLDRAEGIARFGGEKEYLKILRSFAVNTKDLLDGIRTVDAGGLAGYATTVHGIRGSARNIGAGPLGARAEALERAAKEGDAAFVLRHNPAFLEEAERLLAGIGAALAAADAAHPRPRRDAPDRRALLRLRDACAEYDFDAMEAAMDELDGCVYGTGGELVEWLRERTLKMDFQAIADRLASV